MAWRGLSEAPVFDVLFPQGTSQRQRVLNRYAAEQNGTTIGAGTPNSQTTIGLPCN